MSEAQILQQEADRARAAISQALSDLGQSLKATADPHVLTRDHPWLAISTAAVAGFAAAITLIPSKEQQALRALAELERARHSPPPSTPPTSPSSSESDKSAAIGGIFGTIAAEALKTLRPLLTTLLSASVSRVVNAASNNPHNNPEADGNGHAAAEEEIPSPS